MKPSPYIAPALLVIVFALVSFLLALQIPSPDLMASWLAGVFFQAGHLDQIYPQDTAVYTMLPPSGWRPALQAQGYDDLVFPFIYPPLWAWLAGHLTQITTFDMVKTAAGLVNPVLLGGMVILAHRALDTRLSALGFVALGLVLLGGTVIGTAALQQNQLQILVSFLIVLALERARAGAPRIAGTALALAAAVKLYPVLLVPVWLAMGERRAAGWFVLSGGALAAASVYVAGWPLHEAFLTEIRIIGQSVMVTEYALSLDAALSQIFMPDALQFIAGLDTPAGTTAPLGWFVVQKSPLWVLASRVANLTALAAFCLLARHRPQEALIWPLALGVFALLGSLSWGYHYLPVAAFAPVLLDRFGPLRGTLALMAVFLPLTLPMFGLIQSLPPVVDMMFQLTATAAMALLCVFYALALKPGRD